MTAFFTVSSNSMSLFLGTLRAGKRSPISPMMMVTSSVIILGRLKSLKALMSTWFKTDNGEYVVI